MSRMPPHSSDRRTAFRNSYANAFLWAIGNGLTSTTLILYLALDFGATGLWVSLIVASPHVAGLLRLATPLLLRVAADRVRFTLICFFLSNLLLLTLPLLTLTGTLRSSQQVLPAVVLLWAGYHLLEYMGVVSLWWYFRDLAPRPIRGRFLGYRERWLLAGQVLGMLAAGLFSYAYRSEGSRLGEFVQRIAMSLLGLHLPAGRWVGLAIPALAGAMFMLLSLLPLRKLPRLKTSTELAHTPVSLLTPLADPRFRWLLLFIVWFGLTNGLTQAAQALFPYRVLGFSALWLLSLRSGMVVGQSLVAGAVGRMIDQWGNRPVMILSALLVAAGPLFYLAASLWHPALFVVAWILWIAYVGLNIGLPNLTWKLSGREQAPTYLAVYLAASGLAYAIGTISGGLLYDSLAIMGKAGAFASLSLGTFPVNEYTLLFLGGWLLRTVGAVWLWRIREPGVPAAQGVH